VGSVKETGKGASEGSDVGFRVPGRQGDPEAGGPFANGGWANGWDQEPVIPEFFGGFEGKVVGAKDDGKDGGGDGIGGKVEEGAELSDVRMKVGAQHVALR